MSTLNFIHTQINIIHFKIKVEKYTWLRSESVVGPIRKTTSQRINLVVSNIKSSTSDAFFS